MDSNVSSHLWEDRLWLEMVAGLDGASYALDGVQGRLSVLGPDTVVHISGGRSTEINSSRLATIVAELA